MHKNLWKSCDKTTPHSIPFLLTSGLAINPSPSYQHVCTTKRTWSDSRTTKGNQQLHDLCSRANECERRTRRTPTTKTKGPEIFEKNAWNHLKIVRTTDHQTPFVRTPFASLWKLHQIVYAKNFVSKGFIWNPKPMPRPQNLQWRAGQMARIAAYVWEIFFVPG